MRLLLLLVCPALLGALSVINVLPRRNFLPDSVFQKLASDDPPDMTQDLTTFKEFVPFYVNLFKEAMTKKTRETFLAHMNYVDKEMLFHECHAVQYENYGAFANWFQQFVTYHDDPIVEITSQRQTGNDQGEMILNVDVQAQFKYRQNFDMKVAALNDKKLGWKVLIVDRTLGCR
ncbi:hypothetical protein B9Z55_011818 [Caenorhabditis nigoni]|uniref:SnoaL-like domain-containing protein n=1 Tax=Caenorhabditis nigoni TaxID=1611254 RepID=A0A2G5UMM1_9PELO|nr:hypothetical protein B9Z55_011818 [Caenorhabditis nigoni]